MSDGAPAVGWILCFLSALVSACSPTDSENPSTDPTVNVSVAIAAAGGTLISDGPQDRDQTCARQTIAFTFSGDWARFLETLATELPPDFERRDGAEAGTTRFGRLLPADSESIEVGLEPGEEERRARAQHVICES